MKNDNFWTPLDKAAMNLITVTTEEFWILCKDTLTA